MDSGFRRNDGFWTFDEFIKLRFPAQKRRGNDSVGTFAIGSVYQI